MFLMKLFDVDNPVNREFLDYLFTTEGHLVPLQKEYREWKQWPTGEHSRTSRRSRSRPSKQQGAHARSKPTSRPLAPDASNVDILGASSASPTEGVFALNASLVDDSIFRHHVPPRPGPAIPLSNFHFHARSLILHPFILYVKYNLMPPPDVITVGWGGQGKMCAHCRMSRTRAMCFVPIPTYLLSVPCVLVRANTI